jgi:NADH:ubiquinone oxidoreductase subunit H
VSLLISVGFFTLLERKILGLRQLRLGPNKTRISGTLQPILDGVKLLKKLSLINNTAYTMLFCMLRTVILVFSLILWRFLPFYIFSLKNLWIFFILVIIRLSRLCFLLLGWSRINKYRFLGSIRRLRQILRFEINFRLILFLLFLILNRITIIYFIIFMPRFNLVLMLIIGILILLESQRAPIDLSERERELVRGYNIEFRRIFFTLIFLSEYLNMILLIGVFCQLSLRINLKRFLIILFLILIIRSCYPRVRYDILIQIFWLKILPRILLLFFLYHPLKFF